MIVQNTLAGAASQIGPAACASPTGRAIMKPNAQVTARIHSDRHRPTSPISQYCGSQSQRMKKAAPSNRASAIRISTMRCGFSHSEARATASIAASPDISVPP